MSLRANPFCHALFTGAAVAFALSGNVAFAAAPKPTAIHAFVPKIPSGTPVSGNCWTTSIATNRAGAFRCMNGNSISDPCFTTAKTGIVVCDADPTTGKAGFAMRVKGPLPASPPVKGPVTPWLLQLAGGTTCQPFTGTRALIGKQVIGYGCTPSKGQDADTYVGLVDTLDTTSPVWYARKIVYRVTSSGATVVVSSARVAIAAVWR